MELEKESNSLKLELTSIREEMNLQFTKIMSLIQQNPLLAHIKIEVLARKSVEMK